MKKISGWKWKGLILLAIIVVAARIVYVNITYPKTKVTYYEIGEEVPYEEFQVCCNSVEIYKTSDISDYLTNHNIEFEQEQIAEVTEKEDAYIYLVDLDVKNTSDQVKEFNSRRASLCSGNSLNCFYNLYVTGIMNEGEFRKEIEPSQSVHMTVAYNIIRNDLVSKNQFEKLVHGKCSISFLTFYQMNEIVIKHPEIK